jgi:hypothetical protein
MLEVKAGTLDHGFPPITDRSSPENARVLEASHYLAKKYSLKGNKPIHVSGAVRARLIYS